MPSTLSSGIPSVSRFRSRLLLVVPSFRSSVTKSLIVFPVSGAPTENDRSIVSRRRLPSGSTSTNPLTPKPVNGSAIGSVW